MSGGGRSPIGRAGEPTPGGSLSARDGSTLSPPRSGVKSPGEKHKAELAALKKRHRERVAAVGAYYRARIERERIVRGLRKTAQSPSVPWAYRMQILRIMATWQGLGTPSMRPDPEAAGKMPGLEDFLRLEMASPFDEPDDTPAWIKNAVDEGKPGRLGELSLAQLREIKRLVDAMAHIGRESDRMLAARERQSISETAEECAAQSIAVIM